MLRMDTRLYLALCNVYVNYIHVIYVYMGNLAVHETKPVGGFWLSGATENLEIGPIAAKGSLS